MAGTEQASQAGATVWKIDPAHTTVEFSAKHMMITTVKGRFGELSGTILANEAKPELSSVEVEIEAASLDTRTEQRDAHLRSADFLDVENFPTIDFRSTRIEGAATKPGEKFKVTGQLTIRGVTREVVLDAVFEGAGKDPWGGDRSSFSATTKINRTDWGLTWNQTLETGGILVSNDIKISVEVQAVKSTE